MNYYKHISVISLALILSTLAINNKVISAPNPSERFNELCGPLYDQAYPEPSANLKEVQFNQWGIKFSIPDNYVIRKDQEAQNFMVISEGLDAYLDCGEQLEEEGYFVPGHGIGGISISELELSSHSSNLETVIQEHWEGGKIIQSFSTHSLTVHLVKNAGMFNAVLKVPDQSKAIVFQTVCDCGPFSYEETELEEILSTLKPM